MTYPASPEFDALFQKNDGGPLPTLLSRRTWDERARHGGAVAALLAHVAETEGPGPAWQLNRMSSALIKSVPVAPLANRTEIPAGRG